MNCARCRGEMEKRPLRGVLIDHCRPCNAVWLDAGELEDLSAGAGDSDERLATQRAAETRSESREAVQAANVCPRCQGALLAETLGGAEIDRCRRCGGLLFDHGELALVLAALRPGRLRAWWRRLRRS